MLAAGVAVNWSVCAAAVVAPATALSGLVGWNMSVRSSFQTLKRRVARTWNAYSVPGVRRWPSASSVRTTCTESPSPRRFAANGAASPTR